MVKLHKEGPATKDKTESPSMFAPLWLICLGFIAWIPFAFTSITDKTQRGMGLLSFVALILLFPYPRYQRWLKTQSTVVTRFVDSLFKQIADVVIKPLIMIAIVGLILWISFMGIKKVIDWITPDKWTLMVCDEKLNSSECSSNSYVIPGFRSSKECLLEGATRFSKQGFECGSNCRNEYGLYVCKSICNKSGCRD